MSGCPPRRASLISLALTIVALALASAPAEAAFPGANGRISLTHSLSNFFEKPSGWTMNANGTDQRTIALATNVDPTGGPIRDVRSALRFSPDGQHVVYSWFPFAGTCVANRLDQPTQLRIANVDGTGTRDLTQVVCGTALNGAVTLRNDDLDPSWSPDSTRVVFTSRRGCVKQRDPQCQSKTEIWSVRASDGQDLRQLTAGPNDSQPTWGTNGRIAFVRNGDLWTMNPDGSGQTQLTSGAANDVEPNWSPDGQKIVFSSNRDELGRDCVAQWRCDYEIYSINANGTGLTRLTTRLGKQDIAPVFSPDGRKIAWSGDGPVSGDVFTMNADGTEQTNVTNATRPDPPLNCCGSDFSAFYMTPDWQPVTGIPPALPAPAIRTELALGYAFAGRTSETGTVFVSQRAPAGGMVVNLSSSDPAHASVPASVTIPAGAQQADYTITLHTPAAQTTATITTSIPGRSATTSMTLYPAPTDVNFFASGGATTVKPGQDVTVGANLNAPAAAGGTTVTFTSDHPSVMPVPASVSYPEGISGGGFIVHVGSVTTATPVTLTAHFGTVTHTLSFTVAAGPQLTALALSPATVTGPGSSTGTVTLSEAPGVAESAHVALSSSDPTLVAMSTEAIIGFGATTASFTINANRVTTQQTVTITATLGAVTKTATLTINPPASTPPAALSSLSFSPSSVRGGTSSTGTVRLDRAAPSGGLSVGLSSPNAAVSVPASVTVPAGQTSTTFTAATSTVTASTPVDVTASAAGSPDAVGRLTVTAQPTDTVTITRAQYDTPKRSLRIEATGSDRTATLTAFVDSTGARIGTLTNAGGGQYRGTFSNVANPVTVRVTSSLGGSATRALTGASGTVRPTTVVTAAPTTTSTAKSVSAPVLRATAQVDLPAADPTDKLAPEAGRLRILPRRFRIATRRGTLISFSLGEAAQVRLTFARLSRGRVTPAQGAIARTLPAGRVRVRFDGRLGGRALRPGVYRVMVAATDASGNAAPPLRALLYVHA